MCLSLIVVIEMLNSLNALSENVSIFKVGIFSNIYLIFAIISSICLHSIIIYTPFLRTIFKVCYLKCDDWVIIFSFSIPVIFIDEFLKLV